MHVTYWYYRITQCDILSLIIYITYISCLNNENAIVNPRGYDYFRNRWNLVILKHRRSLGVREGALTVQCTLRRRPALISFHVTIPKWVYMYHSLSQWQQDRQAFVQRVHPKSATIFYFCLDGDVIRQWEKYTWSWMTI